SVWGGSKVCRPSTQRASKQRSRTQWAEARGGSQLCFVVTAVDRGGCACAVGRGIAARHYVDWLALGRGVHRSRLGKNFLSCCSIGRVRSCVRPVLCGGEAAGHNALRGSGPNQKHAFKDALTQTGSPDPRIDLVCITSSCPRQFLQTSNAVVVSWPHLLESLWL